MYYGAVGRFYQCKSIFFTFSLSLFLTFFIIIQMVQKSGDSEISRKQCVLAKIILTKVARLMRLKKHI